MNISYIIKYRGQIHYLKTEKIVKAILLEEPQTVLKRTII